MAAYAMPPMVVSSNRFLDIEPYANRLRGADPIRWGSVFPWEFPQNATRSQEEAFLCKWFSNEEIHVQGGAGDEKTSGAGFRFLKHVWYCQAIFNWNQRAPALNDWWWENSESASLIHDPSMHKYFLDSNAELTTFFQSKEVEMYGEKFLRQVVPLIQQTAKARIEEQEVSKQNATGTQTTQAAARVSDSIAASEPPMAAPDDESGMSGLTKAASQPLEAKAKTLSPPEAEHAAPKSAVVQAARPHVPNNEIQAPQEQSHFVRKRGNSSNRRYNNTRGGHFQLRQSFQPSEPEMLPPQAYCTQLGTPAVPYSQHSSGAPRGHIDFGSGFAHGQPSMAPASAHNPFHAQFPSIDVAHHHGTFATPTRFVDGLQQQQIIWAPNLFFDRSNEHGLGRTVSAEVYTEGDSACRGARGHLAQGSRGGKTRASAGNRARGNRGRNSFGAHRQPLVGFPNHDAPRSTSGDFKSPVSDAKVRRGSVVTEKNWRGGKDRPQEHAVQVFDENTTPTRHESDYVPALYSAPFNHKPRNRASTNLSGYSPSVHASWGQEWHPQAVYNLPNDPRYHCTPTFIGDLCPYVRKLIVFDVPFEMQESELAHYFRTFGRIESIYKIESPPAQIGPHQPLDSMVIVTFATTGDARACLRNKPRTWLGYCRPLRLEVSKQYWDPHHKWFQQHRMRPIAMAPAFEPRIEPRTQVQAPRATHQAHDSSSTIRSPVAEKMERQSESGETTPTASGSSTPRKKNNKFNNKRTKKSKDLRVATLASSADQTPSTVTKSVPILPAPEVAEAKGSTIQLADKAVLTKPGLDEKHRSASGSTERQTTSEPSFTPIDEIQTKLPSPDTMSEGGKRKPPVVEKLSDSPVEANVHSAGEALAPDDLARVHLPLDGDQPGRLFRDAKTEAQTPATDMKDSAQSAAAAFPGSPKTAVATPIKAEDEPADDSFHTATDSPSSSATDDGKCKEHEQSAAKALVSPAAETLEDDKLTEKSTGPAAAELSSSEGKEVPILDQPDDLNTLKPPSLTLDMQSLSKGKKRKAANRSTSGGSALNSATAFVTAPNTPVVNQDLESTAATGETAPSELQRAEKSKGPAKTESFSFFGKKQEKKNDKKSKSKKGTLKGRPKDLDSAGAEESDKGTIGDTADAFIASRAQVQKLDTADRNVHQAQLQTTQDRDRVHTKVGAPVHGGAATPTDLAGTLPPTDDAPSKHRGSILSGMAKFSRSLLRQQPQNYPEEKQDLPSKTTKSSLTDVKAPEIDAKQQTTTAVPLDSAQAEASAGCVLQSQEPHSIVSTAPDFTDTKTHEDNSATTADNDVLKDATPSTGLGITAEDHVLDTYEAAQKPKKRKRKPKKNNKKPADVTELTRDTTPEPGSEQTNTSADLCFRLNLQAATPHPFRSDCSDASSNTLGDATPSSGAETPMIAKQLRKLPPSAQNKDTLVQSKEPFWKKARRVHRDNDRNEGSIVSMVEEDDLYRLESASESNAGGLPTPLDIVDAPAGKDDNDDASKAVEQSKARMQELQEQEKRLRQKKEAKAQTPMQIMVRAQSEDDNEGNLVRLDEILASTPGKRIIVLHPED